MSKDSLLKLLMIMMMFCLFVCLFLSSLTKKRYRKMKRAGEKREHQELCAVS